MAPVAVRIAQIVRQFLMRDYTRRAERLGSQDRDIGVGATASAVRVLVIVACRHILHDRLAAT
jgi:hypothetical protein